MEKEIQKFKKEASEELANIKSLSYLDSTLLKAGVNLIPGIGGALHEIFSHGANRVQRQKFEDFFSCVKETFKDFDEKKMDKSFVESDDFTELVMRCLKLSLKTSANRKVKLFSQILKNAVVAKDFNLEKFEEIESLLENISYREFLFMQQLEEWTKRLNEEYFKMLNYAHEMHGEHASINGERMPKYRSFYHAFCIELSKSHELSREDIRIIEKTCDQKGLVEQGELNYSNKFGDSVARKNSVSSSRTDFGHFMKLKPTILFRHLKNFIGEFEKEN